MRMNKYNVTLKFYHPDDISRNGTTVQVWAESKEKANVVALRVADREGKLAGVKGRITCSAKAIGREIKAPKKRPSSRAAIYFSEGGI